MNEWMNEWIMNWLQWAEEDTQRSTATTASTVCGVAIWSAPNRSTIRPWRTLRTCSTVLATATQTPPWADWLPAATKSRCAVDVIAAAASRNSPILPAGSTWIPVLYDIHLNWLPSHDLHYVCMYLFIF